MATDSKPLELRVSQGQYISCPFGGNTIIMVDQERRQGRCVLAEQAQREKKQTLWGFGGCIEYFLDKNGCPKPGGYVGWEAVLPLKVKCKYTSGQLESL